MKKGFTLIELLVVIAIIMILASVVLVAFPGATKKAKDSRIVSAISQARTVMVYIYGNEVSYASFTCAHSEMDALCKEIDNNYGADTLNDKVPEPVIASCTTCGADNGPAACIYSPLNAKTDYWYCADSTGVAGFVSGSANNPGGVGFCVAATAKCPAVTG